MLPLSSVFDVNLLRVLKSELSVLGSIPSAPCFMPSLIARITFCEFSGSGREVFEPFNEESYTVCFARLREFDRLGLMLSGLVFGSKL